MNLDYKNALDLNAQHLTTEETTNHIDLGEPRNIGVGAELYVVAVVTTAMTDGGSDSTMTLTLETDDATAGAPTGSWTTRQTVGTFAATSPAGTRLVARLQPDAINERFLRGKWTVANGDLSTGKFTVGIVKDIDAFTAYASGFTIA